MEEEKILRQVSPSISLCLGADGVPFIRLGDEIMRLELEEINEHYREMAKTELRETPEVVNEAIEKLKELIQGEPNLCVPVDEEAFLKKFLRRCKYYPESAFKLMKKFYKFKQKHPLYWQNLYPSQERKVFDEEIIQFVSRRDKNGCRIMIIQCGKKWNTKKVALTDIFRAVMIALEAAVNEPTTQVTGVVVILDHQGFSLSHVWQFTPSIAKIILEFVQECTPLRLKAIHIINQPYIFNMVYTIFKPFITEKLRKRLHFHGSNRQSLYQHVDQNTLPISYGGQEVPDYPGDLLSEIICHFDKEFEVFNTYGYTTKDVS